MAQRAGCGSGCAKWAVGLVGLLVILGFVARGCDQAGDAPTASSRPPGSRLVTKEDTKPASRAVAKPSPKFEQIGYRKKENLRFFTYYVENVTEEDIRRFCKERKRYYTENMSRQRILWIDFFIDREHTPDVTLDGPLPESCFPYRVASYRYNPFSKYDQLIFDIAGPHAILPERRAKEQREAEARAKAEKERHEAIEAAKWRTWIDSSGKHKIEAKFGGLAFGKVKLVKRDGSTIELPLEKLCDEDQQWIKKKRSGTSR